MAERVYLDWNATAPLRPEARAAMLAAMDLVGNPSSVHAEGRATKGLIEKARGQVARLVGCDQSQIVFTSGATEAANTAFDAKTTDVIPSAIEHDSVFPRSDHTLACDGFGLVRVESNPEGCALQAANSETGVRQSLPPNTFLVDAVQAIGKVAFDFVACQCRYSMVSGHKIGSAKGVGALLVRGHDGLDPIKAVDPIPMIQGGGQEMGRRSGTENVIGIAGFGAAAEAAQRDLESGVWDRVEKLRNILEETLATASNETIFVGKEVARLPNTSCFITPGWKGETQVMRMDLAGFAISAGSACSSGKVKESRVLRAMGFDSVAASSAVRVSIGPTTTEDEVMAFAQAWTQAFQSWKARAA